jgi:hypothetical protein
MVQICFRVPSDVADFIRDMSIRNDRQPGAELARMIRPAIETERKRRAWEEQQQAHARPKTPIEQAPKGGAGKKVRKEPAASPPAAAEQDLFALASIEAPTSQV